MKALAGKMVFEMMESDRSDRKSLLKITLNCNLNKNSVKDRRSLCTSPMYVGGEGGRRRYLPHPIDPFRAQCICICYVYEYEML